MQRKRLNRLYYFFLFSTLGLIAYVLLANATNLPTEADLLYEFVWGYLFFIIAFNVLGFLIIRLSLWIGRYIMQRWKMVLLYSCVAVVLLFVNYGLLVLAKMLVGVDNPFIFNRGGGILIILWLLDLIIVGLLVVNQSVRQNMLIQQEASKLREENNKAQYVALQGQLNPHFLFNNLNTLIAEIEYDPSNAVLFTRNLSDAYRYVLQCQDKMLISISDELKFLNAYLFLHRVRIGNFITVEYDIPEIYYDSKIPPLTLQLLIENVIKHNIISETSPMRITIAVCDNLLVVSNTINPKKVVEKGSGKGLENLSNRSRLMSRKEITIVREGDLFTVKVPVLYE